MLLKFQDHEKYQAIQEDHSLPFDKQNTMECRKIMKFKSYSSVKNR